MTKEETKVSEAELADLAWALGGPRPKEKLTEADYEAAAALLGYSTPKRTLTEAEIAEFASIWTGEQTPIAQLSKGPEPKDQKRYQEDVRRLAVEVFGAKMTTPPDVLADLARALVAPDRR